MNKKNIFAIVLAAGKGKRMQSDVAKQYMMLSDKPILYYSLKAFEDNSAIDGIILVVGKDDIQYCITDIIKKYGFSKVHKVIIGGKERYESVYNALCVIDNVDYVLIHDGARPFLNDIIIDDVICAVKEYKACIVGVPTKDTIKVINSEGIVDTTPNRDTLYQIQTPQAFEYQLIKIAYDKLMMKPLKNVTDDSMVFELMTNHSVRIVEGCYDNIKITTPHDMIFAQSILDSKKAD